MNFLDHQMKGDILPPFSEPASLALYLFSRLQFKAASSPSCPFFCPFSPFFCPFFAPLVSPAILPPVRHLAALLARPRGRSCPHPAGRLLCRAALLLKLPAVWWSSCWPANSPTPPLPLPPSLGSLLCLAEISLHHHLPFAFPPPPGACVGLSLARSAFSEEVNRVECARRRAKGFELCLVAVAPAGRPDVKLHLLLPGSASKGRNQKQHQQQQQQQTNK